MAQIREGVGSMSHIVIHDDVDDITQYRLFDDIDAAAVYLEELHDREGFSGARLYALEEVEFAVKSYVKVEIGGLAPIVPITGPADGQTPGGVDDRAEMTDDVAFVEAPMNPFDAFAPAPADHEAIGTGEARRGLFGR
jgi:hypothetical protein